MMCEKNPSSNTYYVKKVGSGPSACPCASPRFRSSQVEYEEMACTYIGGNNPTPFILESSIAIVNRQVHIECTRVILGVELGFL